jgi:ABC-type Co2+ transport system permease subunit
MGVGSNPTTWFVVIAFLIVVRFGLEYRKEAPMETKTVNVSLMARVKSVLTNVLTAFTETNWAVLTNIVAGMVTLSIYAKGAPRLG